MGRARRGCGIIDAAKQPMDGAMPHVDDLSRSLTAFDQDSTLIAVIWMSRKSWLVAGIVPGVGRAPLKKLKADEDGVLLPLHRWREAAAKAGRRIVIERTIAWPDCCRRPAKDWANLKRKALAFLRLASIRTMLRKLCNPSSCFRTDSQKRLAFPRDPRPDRDPREHALCRIAVLRR